MMKLRELLIDHADQCIDVNGEFNAPVSVLDKAVPILTAEYRCFVQEALDRDDDCERLIVAAAINRTPDAVTDALECVRECLRDYARYFCGLYESDVWGATSNPEPAIND